MRRSINIVIILILGLLVSCKHKDLCYDHSHVREVDVFFDWSSAPDAMPESMSLYLYPENGGPVQRYEFANYQGGRVRILDGTYHAICVNSDVRDVVALNINSFNSFELNTKDISMLYGQYGVLSKSIPRTSGAENERIVTVPECIWSHHITDIVIDDITKYFTLGPVSNVISGSVTINNVENLNWVKGVTTTLSSMAGGYQPQFESITEERVTLAFNCTPSMEDNKLTGTFTTFGCCPFEMIPHKLIVYVELYDDSRWYYEFDVTDQLHEQEGLHEIVIEIDHLPVPRPVVDGGGFTPSIEEWQEITYDIKM